MKSKTGWENDGNGNNESGFSGLPGGYLYGYGEFYFIGTYGSWWSSKDDNTIVSWPRNLDSNSDYISRYSSYQNTWRSCRCIKDSSPSVSQHES